MVSVFERKIPDQELLHLQGSLIEFHGLNRTSQRVRTKFENKVRGGIVFGNKSIGVKQDELADHYGTWQEVPVDVKLQFFNLW